jgi:hypothetical protein
MRDEGTRGSTRTKVWRVRDSQIADVSATNRQHIGVLPRTRLVSLDHSPAKVNLMDATLAKTPIV